MDKQYFGANKRKAEHFLGRQLTKLICLKLLAPIIQSEVSQKEKHQYSILTHIYGI